MRMGAAQSGTLAFAADMHFRSSHVSSNANEMHLASGSTGTTMRSPGTPFGHRASETEAMEENKWLKPEGEGKSERASEREDGHV
jgi:hypothetical protein